MAAALASREAYEAVAPHVLKEDFTPAGGFWWGLIGEWYGRDSKCAFVDRSSLEALGNSRAPGGKHRDALTGFLRDLPADVSPANAATVALELKRHNVGLEVATAIAANDEKKLSRLIPVYTELREATALKAKKQTALYELATPDEHLFAKVGKQNRIPLYPDRLNDRVSGGALPGHHILLFGRSEIGKSTISLNLACLLAARGQQRVLYLGNEDQIDMLKKRAVARLANLTHDEVDADPGKALALYRERGGTERLFFVQMPHGGTERNVRPAIEAFAPTVVVLDQIRNFSGGSDDGMVSRLEGAGQAFRSLLNEYKLVGISVTQAGASAEDKQWLSMTDVDSSKTGLPGTADLMIGIGADATLMSRGQRALSICKNKLSCSANSHEGFVVDIDFAKGIVR